jgi:hypothetical protein
MRVMHTAVPPHHVKLADAVMFPLLPVNRAAALATDARLSKINKVKTFLKEPPFTF